MPNESLLGKSWTSMRLLTRMALMLQSTRFWALNLGEVIFVPCGVNQHVEKQVQLC